MDVHAIAKRNEDGQYTYYLCSRFFIDDLEVFSKPVSAGSKTLSFTYAVKGSKGTRFKPWHELNGEKWFDDLLTATYKFSYGFSEIKLANVIKSLVKLLIDDVKRPAEVLSTKSAKGKVK